MATFDILDVRSLYLRSHIGWTQSPQMTASRTNVIIATEVIAERIFIVRGLDVILDSGLAALYAVPTKRFNQAVKRNLAKFPTDFMFALTATEWEALRSQIVTLSTGQGQYRK